VTGGGIMQTKVDLETRELIDLWGMDSIDLSHQIKNGLPAYFNGRRIDFAWLEALGPDFEKRLSLLTFWKRHVELWEIGGKEALDEGTRLRFPKMGDSPEPRLDGLISPIKKLSSEQKEQSPQVKKEKQTKPCPACGNYFELKHGSQKYCKGEKCNRERCREYHKKDMKDRRTNDPVKYC